MRLSFVILIVTALACVYLAQACEPAQSQHGCKIYGVSCTCGYGCKTEFTYRSRRACLSALRERSSNVCYRLPCVRGICIQTVQEPGFTCKCEGTGFFGFRCEKESLDLATYPFSEVISKLLTKNEKPSSPSVCHVSGGFISKLCKILASIPKQETVKKVKGQYNCAGWCTRIIASNSSISN